MKLNFKNRKFVIGIVCGVIILLFAGKLTADSQANAYRVASAEQNNTFMKLQTQSDKLQLSNKIIVGREETDDELRILEKTCADIATFFEGTKNLNNKPVLSFNPFGGLSPRYQMAKEEQPIAAGAKDLMTHTENILSGCINYVESIKISKMYNQFESQRNALITPLNTNDCESEIGCLQEKDRAEYKKYYEEEVTLSKKAADFFASKCTFKDNDKICKLQLQYYTEQIPLRQAYYDALIGGDISAASDKFKTSLFPTEAICTEARIISGKNDITKSCSTEAIVASAKKYEALISKQLNR